MKSLPALRNLSLAALASLSLGGCYYGDVYGASYASADCYSRYGDQYWVNDPFAYDDGYYGYDCYDAADYRSGFVQIGFGGGWYQQLYYPGYGLFLFDRYGRRHSMSQDYLTYWGGRRAWWKHHGHRFRDHDGRRGDGYGNGRPGRGYAPSAPPQPPAGANNGWYDGAAAVPAPRERMRGEGRRGDGWRGRQGNDWTAPPASGTAPPAASPGAPESDAPPRIRRGGGGWGGYGSGQGGGGWTPPATDAPPVNAAPPRPARIPQYSPPTAGNEGATVRVTPAPPVRVVREVDYAPPPPPRSEAPSRDGGGPIRED